VSRSDDPRDAGMERILAAASRPKADPEYRSRLREQFLEGAAGVTRAGPRLDRERTSVFPLVWPFVLAASVAAIMFFVLSRDAIVKWRVLDHQPGAEYVVDGYVTGKSDPATSYQREGRTADEARLARLSDLLQTAHTIETKEQGLRVQLLDDIVLDLGPGTRVSSLTFPAANQWSIRVDAGSLRIATGPGFSNNRLRVLSNDLEATVTGTAFAVDVLAAGTCLCCLEGSVRCDARDGSGFHPVDAGKNGFAPRTGKKPEWGGAVDAHVAPLRELQDAIRKHGWAK
jgi:hypothetical protein